MCDDLQNTHTQYTSTRVAAAMLCRQDSSSLQQHWIILAERGKLRPPPERSTKLSSAPSAHSYLFGAAHFATQHEQGGGGRKYQPRPVQPTLAQQTLKQVVPRAQEERANERKAKQIKAPRAHQTTKRKIERKGMIHVLGPAKGRRTTTVAQNKAGRRSAGEQTTNSWA